MRAGRASLLGKDGRVIEVDDRIIRHRWSIPGMLVSADPAGCGGRAPVDVSGARNGRPTDGCFDRRHAINVCARGAAAAINVCPSRTASLAPGQIQL